jgi:hypothetical protein
MCFRAWVDQRQHDFWMVRSEGIRSVKLALEAAGMDMPEPTYRLQLTGNQTGLAPAASTPQQPNPSRQPRSPPPRDAIATPDTSARSELDEQISRYQQQAASTNLLDQSAPRE